MSGPGPDWEALADFTGAAYLRYAFTKGTEQEVGFLVEALGLHPGDRVLDAGCGPGRHSHALAARGMRVIGMDLAQRFVELAAAGAAGAGTIGRPVDSTTGGGAGGSAHFLRADVRRPPVRPASLDAVVCLGQGGFGLLGGGPDEAGALGALAALLRPGGVMGVTAFSAYFAVRWLEEGERFEAAGGVHHETARVRSESGAEERPFPLASTCFTPRELSLLAQVAGLSVEAVWSVEPGRWARREPQIDLPELLMVARRPGDSL